MAALPILIGARDVVDGAAAGATLIDVTLERGARHLVHINPLVPIRNDLGTACSPLYNGACRRGARGIERITEQAGALKRPAAAPTVAATSAPPTE